MLTFLLVIQILIIIHQLAHSLSLVSAKLYQVNPLTICKADCFVPGHYLLASVSKYQQYFAAPNFIIDNVIDIDRSSFMFLYFLMSLSEQNERTMPLPSMVLNENYGSLIQRHFIIILYHTLLLLSSN